MIQTQTDSKEKRLKNIEEHNKNNKLSGGAVLGQTFGFGQQELSNE